MTTIASEDGADARGVTDYGVVAHERPTLPIARNTVLLVAAQASVGVMVAVMALTGAMVVDHFHHHDHNVFPIVGVSVIGMYALVIVVGDVIDRLGRTVSLSATAELAERTRPWERGRLLGSNDMLSGATGAGLTLLGGLVLTTAGVTVLAIGATALVIVPGLWILRHGAAATATTPRQHASLGEAMST